MVDVSETRLINIDNYINSDDFIIDGKGPILQLRSNKNPKKFVEEALEYIKAASPKIAPMA